MKPKIDIFVTLLKKYKIKIVGISDSPSMLYKGKPFVTTTMVFKEFSREKKLEKIKNSSIILYELTPNYMRYAIVG